MMDRLCSRIVIERTTHSPWNQHCILMQLVPAGPGPEAADPGNVVASLAGIGILYLSL